MPPKRKSPEEKQQLLTAKRQHLENERGWQKEELDYHNFVRNRVLGKEELVALQKRILIEAGAADNYTLIANVFGVSRELLWHWRKSFSPSERVSFVLPMIINSS